MMLAFYNPKGGPHSNGGNGLWMDKLICLWTRGDYSHVELVFADTPGVQTMCFSSSPRDGGTRFKRIDTTDRKWMCLPVPCTPEEEQSAMVWCTTHQGRKYDWPGVLGFVFGPFIRQRPRAYFCSEACIRALAFGAKTSKALVGLRKLKAYRYDPGDLYRHTQEAWR